jgi:hypothetical protein
MNRSYPEIAEWLALCGSLGFEKPLGLRSDVFLHRLW